MPKKYKSLKINPEYPLVKEKLLLKVKLGKKTKFNLNKLTLNK